MKKKRIIIGFQAQKIQMLSFVLQQHRQERNTNTNTNKIMAEFILPFVANNCLKCGLHQKSPFIEE
jgi:hypothetical protein